MKATILAALIFLLGGCPFLPPDPYQYVSYGVSPTSFISLPLGKSIEDAEELTIPGPYVIVSVSSELNGETLSATPLFAPTAGENAVGPRFGTYAGFQNPMDRDDRNLRRSFDSVQVARLHIERQLLRSRNT